MALAGCGGDDEKASTDASTSTGPREPAVTAPSSTDPPTDATEPPATESPRSSPEDQPGGAGDELPVRSPVSLTGKGGRIRPALVQVPPFISIRIELRSADGRTYGLRFGSRELSTDGKTVRIDVEGQRPGRALVGRPVGGGSPVRIEASAEPGP